MFFVPCDSWQTLFFPKVCRYYEIFTTAILLFSLKQLFWKKFVFYDIGDNGKFQKKLLYTIFKNTWKTFVADFFYENVFYTLYFFNCSTHFFIKLFLFWKTQNISESMFLHNTVELLSIAFLFTKDLYKRWVFYIKWERNYISKLHSMMKHILMSLFKEITERQKKKFSKRNRRNCRPT